jgi:hypothetical protein
MATKKQIANLRRGGVPATPEAAARARAQKASLEQADEDAAQAVREDPQAALSELHADLVRGVRFLTRRWINARGEPSRALIEAWRELRMLSAEVAALRRERGDMQEAEAFFATLEKRLENLTDLDALAEKAKPLSDV